MSSLYGDDVTQLVLNPGSPKLYFVYLDRKRMSFVISSILVETSCGLRVLRAHIFFKRPQISVKSILQNGRLVSLADLLCFTSHNSAVGAVTETKER